MRFDWRAIPRTMVLTDAISKINVLFERLAGVLNGQNRVDGGVFFEDQYIELEELAADPPAPQAGRVRIYAKAVTGKTTLFARFNTGAVQTIASEP